MQRIRMLALSLAVASVLVAGCTGQFSAQQTEPLRVQLEGTPVQTELNGQSSQAEREFVIVQGGNAPPATQTQKVTVVVNARQTSSTPPTMIVIVKEKDTGRTITQRQVIVQNQTITNIDVDVKGKDNTVVVTQLNGGSATVNVAAQGSGAATGTTGGTATTGDNTTMGNDTITLPPTEPPTNTTGSGNATSDTNATDTDATGTSEYP